MSATDPTAKKDTKKFSQTGAKGDPRGKSAEGMEHMVKGDDDSRLAEHVARETKERSYPRHPKHGMPVEAKREGMHNRDGGA